MMISLYRITSKNNSNTILLSFKIAYFVLSLMILFSLFFLFTLPSDIILKITPICEWKARYGKECFFCGMTRAFIEIKNLNFLQALKNNHLSIPLMFTILLNELICILLILKHTFLNKERLHANS